MSLDLTDPPRAVLDILTRAANEKKSPWRWPVLATKGGAYPGARMLVVRAFNRAALEIELHTDARSAKLDELQAAPACALLFFDKGSMVQLRVDGRARILHGEARDAAFARAPQGSMDDYRGRAPGDDPDAPASAPSPDAAANFAAISIRMERADLLVIARGGHERRFVDFTADPPAWRRAEP
ncbi:pyridoxamine 5'-phosphate oxidase family protein [Maricaulaceae bacterium MS644]